MNLLHSTVKKENRAKVFSDCLILEDEERWVQMYYLLLQRGYALRPRYHPDWVPSWQGLDVDALDYPPEDSIQAYPGLVDAIRVADGQKVVLKHIPTSSEELSISSFVSSYPQTEDRRNHCVPLLDVILIPACETHVLIVIPLLYEHNEIPFRHAGELLEITIQLTECLDFLHAHHIAHRDFCRFNVMIDTTKIIPRGTHPWDPSSAPDGRREGFKGGPKWRSRWSARPNHYFVIDFGYSRKFATNTGVRLLGIYGQDTSVPEMSLTEPYDPFPVDVYHLGNLLLGYYNEYGPDETIDKLSSVAQKMTQKDPAMRPTAEEAAREVRCLSQNIGYFSRSRRVWPAHGYSTRLKWMPIYCHFDLSSMSDSNPPPDQPPNPTQPAGGQSDEERIRACLERLEAAISEVREALDTWDNPAGHRKLGPALRLALRRQRDFRAIFEGSKTQKNDFWTAAKDFLFETFSLESESALETKLAKLDKAVQALTVRASANAELDRIIQQLRSENNNSRNSISRLREAAAQAMPTPSLNHLRAEGALAPRLRILRSYFFVIQASKVSLKLNADKPQAFHTYCRGSLVLAVCLSYLVSYLFDANFNRITFNSPTSSSTGTRPGLNQQTPIYQNRQGMASQPILNSQYASLRPDNLAPPQPALPTSGIHGRPQYATPSAHGSPPVLEQQPSRQEAWRPSPFSAPALRPSRSESATNSSTIQRSPTPEHAQEFTGPFRRTVALFPAPAPESVGYVPSVTSLPPPSPRNRGPRTNPSAAGSRHEASHAQYPQQPVPTVLPAPAASPQAPESSEQAQTRASFGSAFGFLPGEPRARSTRSKKSTASSDIYEEDEYYEK
ncbi:hypothetical protein D9611_013212 [Ephemerocybe angulata]|uniref:Protein kinase domain-containing protein n=1 Tax=Ephemerocybe angulata TaxID=980116 RepID=A0A8H5BTB4_9AGAR|nr:hypothetical protein D9611_013212 [Tulosesus angulatus]